MSAERALTCLPEIGDGALRATQPAALNDPFECTTKKEFVERDREAGNRDLALTLTEIQPRNPVTAEQVEEARVRHGSLYMGELYRQQLSTRFGIVSFSTNPFHPLLWSHYTRDGSGFAIGYKVGVLKSLTTAGVQLQPIRYIPKPGIVIGYRVLSTPESNVIKGPVRSTGESVSRSQRRCGHCVLHGANPESNRCGNRRATASAEQPVWRTEGHETCPGRRRLSIRRRRCRTNGGYGRRPKRRLGITMTGAVCRTRDAITRRPNGFL